MTAQPNRTKSSSIEPRHLVIFAIVIVVAIASLPFLFAKYNEAYPPAGSFERIHIDACAREMPNAFSRWSSSDVAACLAYARIERRYGKH